MNIKNIEEQVLEIIENKCFDNTICPYNIADVPNKPGMYIIMCNKPVPNKLEDQQIKVGENYIWYNGTSANLRSRLKGQLLKNDNYDPSSGIAVEIVDEAELFNNKAYKAKNDNYYKKVPGQPGKRYLNGINIKAEKYDQFVFKAAIIEADILAEALEKGFRNKYGVPPLCKYTKR